ncbi:MAG: damage-inducible protein [Rhodospirillales bacterium]|nr:damage-inducible protein [Rhodospirillales bacterium]
MTGSSVSFSNKISSTPTLLSDLRGRIAEIERGGGPGREEAGAAVVALGVADIDSALPGGGLPRGRLHEVAAAGPKVDGDVAALGFAAALLGRVVNDDGGEKGGTVLWCANRKSLYCAGGLHGPGLAAFGVDARRLILIDGADDTEVLWAMEEGLRSGALGAVAGEVGNLNLAASRRLQLAAEAGGGFGLLVRVSTKKTAKTVTAATTRWEVGAASGQSDPMGVRTVAGALEGLGRACWDVVLARCRGGTERRWRVEWNHETHCFAVAAPVAGQPAVPGPRTSDGRVIDLSRDLPRRAAG